jgi:hypothetical protein
MAVMVDLLLEARPVVEAKCCHLDWCVERRGVVTDDKHLGAPEIEGGMHPGCARCRRWLDRLDRLIGT